MPRPHLRACRYALLFGLAIGAACTQRVPSMPLPPVADAGSDQVARLGATVLLDGSLSHHAAGETTGLTYDWLVVAIPEASAASLSAPTTAQPSFVVDTRGDYIFRLVVRDGELTSRPDVVVIHGAINLAVVSVTPDERALVVSPTEPVTVVFSEPVQQESVDVRSFYVTDGVAIINGVLSLAEGHRVATFTPLTSYPLGQRMKVVLTERIVDLAGSNLGGMFQSYFTVTTGADTRAPRVASIVPADGTLDVEGTEPILVAFSEAMDEVSLAIDGDADGCPDNIVIELQGGGCVPGSIEVTGGGSRALFVPAVALDAGATYTITVVGGAVGLRDIAGNALELDAVATFTVAVGADVTPPRLLWSDPQSGYDGVQVSVQPLVRLSETIAVGSLAEDGIWLEDPDGAVVGQAILSDANRSITFRPDSLLAPATRYTLHVSGAITDLAGNALDGDGDGSPGGDLAIVFDTTSDATLVAIDVQPDPVTLHVGSTLHLSALATSSNDAITDVTSQATWETQDPSVASVNSIGLVRGVGPGDTVVTASYAGLTDNVLVTVVPALVLTPPSATVPPLDQVAFSASGGQTPYTFALTINDSGGSLSAGGAYQAGATGNVTDRVTLYDSAGGSIDASVTVTRALAISPSVASVPPRASVTFSATGGDASYSFALTQINSGATFNTGTREYRAGTTGNTSDQVTVSDGVGASATATISVGPRLALSPASGSTAPLGTIAFAASGGDGSYTFALSPNNSGGSVGATTGAYIAGATGGVSDTVELTDGTGDVMQATVTVNAALSLGLVSGLPSTSPRGTVTLLASGGASGRTYAFVTNASGGTVNPTTGVYMAGNAGDVVDRLRVTDSNGATDTLDITVGPALALGVAPAPATPVEPFGARTFSATGGDGSYTYSITANNSGGSINASGGGYTAGDTGGVTDTVRVTDNVGATASLTVAVGPQIALSPIAAGIPFSGTQGLNATGGSGAYSFAIVEGLPRGSLACGASSCTYTADTSGAPYVEHVQVSDSAHPAATATATVNVAGTLPLAISPTSAVRSPGGTVAFTALGGLPSYTFTFAPGGNLSGGNISTGGAYTAGNTGGVTDIVRVSDSLSGTADAAITVTAAIAITPSSATVPPGGSVAFGATGGNSSYTFSISTNNSGGTIDAGTGAYVAGNAGSVTDTVRVTDGLGKIASATVTVGPAVTIAPTLPSVAPLGAVTFTATGGDGSYTFTISVNNSGGTMSTGGAYTAGATGSTTDTVRVTDGLGKTATTTVTVGPALAISPTTASPAPGGAVAFSATGGSGTNTYSIPINNSGASINPTTGAYVAGALGGVSDTVRVTDSLGSTSQAVVSVLAVVQPTVSVVSPSAISQGTTVDFVINGSNFQAGATVSFSGTGLTVNSVVRDSSTQLTANVTAACAATIGQRNLTVTNPGGLSSTLSNAVSVAAYVLLVGDLRINEVVTDPQRDWNDAAGPFDATPGTGSLGTSDEWLEIISTAACAANISTVVLAVDDSSPTAFALGTNGQVLVFSSGSSLGTFQAGGYLVVGRPSGTASMRDDVWIRLCNGLCNAGNTNVYDDVELGTLDYEGDGSANNAPNGNATSTTNESVYRHPNGVDTNVDNVDFVKGAATIGAANP